MRYTLLTVLLSSHSEAKFTPPRPDGDVVEDSDEEFEHELLAFEQRPQRFWTFLAS